MPQLAPLEREWVSIRDPDDPGVRFTFDVSFLLSDYGCIYGAGCKGNRDERVDEVVGCCTHGAYLSDDDDVALVEAGFAEMDADRMQYFDLATTRGFIDEVDPDDDEDVEPAVADRDLKTAVVDGACIFLNRDDGSGRPIGCVFHHLALDTGVHHMTHKPWVCWQLPLHREITEQVDNDGSTLETHTIGPFERGSWGGGGADFLWWCTEAPEAFGQEHPVYVSMEHELRAMVGHPVYEGLRAHLDSRRRQQNRPRFLPVIVP